MYPRYHLEQPETNNNYVRAYLHFTITFLDMTSFHPVMNKTFSFSILPHCKEN